MFEQQTISSGRLSSKNFKIRLMSRINDIIIARHLHACWYEINVLQISKNMFEHLKAMSSGGVFFYWNIIEIVVVFAAYI